MEKPKIRYGISHGWDIEGMTDKECAKSYKNMIDALIEARRALWATNKFHDDSFVMKTIDKALKKAGCKDN